MGLNTSSMNMGLVKGVSMSQLLSLVTDKLYDQFIEKDIKDFNGFHRAILDTFSTINMALPGKHYDPPSLKDITDLFDQWKKEENDAKRKEVFTEFMKKNVNMNKVDESMIITAIVAPPAAMVAKRTGQTLPQLKLMKSVPDVVFVPSATVVALIAVKILRYMFKGKTTTSSKDDAATPHDHDQLVPPHDQQESTAPQSAAKPGPGAPASEEKPKHAPPNFFCALCDRYHSNETMSDQTQQQHQQRSLWSTTERRCLYLLQSKNNTFSTLLQIHAFILRRSLHHNINLLTKFISTSASLATATSSFTRRHAIVQHARHFFDHTPHNHRDMFLCNAMINTHFSIRQFCEAFTLYRGLYRERTINCGYTFTALVKGCTACMAKREGLEVHGVVVKNGFCSDLYVATALVDMYVKFGVLGAARKVFDEMSERSVVSWTAVIAGYVRCGDVSEARKLFDEMPERDSAAVNVMIDGYVKLGCMDLAKDLFDRMGDKNVISWTSMISGYCHNGDVESARLMFDLMPEKNLITWNAMIGGYCWNKRPHEALRLFCEMQSNAAMEPNEVTLVSVLPAIADLGALDLGGWIHRFAQRKKLDRYANVRTTLIDMYAKCGEIAKAKLLFEEMPQKETSSWNALINGFAVNGCAKEALEAFAMMIQEGFEPNKITMIGVLSACCHCGLVEEGRRWFKAMEKFGITPQIEHYGCMVDLLGKAGCLDEAEKLIQTMPYSANEIILSSFLFACGYFKDVERAERVLQEAEKTEKLCIGDYVMMRNLYATEQRWTDVEDVKRMMKKRGSYKEIACSVIEVDGSFREFVAGYHLHSHLEAIQLTLVQLWTHMKAEMIYLN